MQRSATLRPSQSLTLERLRADGPRTELLNLRERQSREEIAAECQEELRRLVKPYLVLAQQRRLARNHGALPPVEPASIPIVTSNKQPDDKPGHSYTGTQAGRVATLKARIRTLQSEMVDVARKQAKRVQEHRKEEQFWIQHNVHAAYFHRTADALANTVLVKPPRSTVPSPAPSTHASRKQSMRVDSVGMGLLPPLLGALPSSTPGSRSSVSSTPSHTNSLGTPYNGAMYPTRSPV